MTTTTHQPRTGEGVETLPSRGTRLQCTCRDRDVTWSDSANRVSSYLVVHGALHCFTTLAT